MEIIDELENNKRNLYTGSIGYLTLDGGCDFNIVIRTALYKDGKYYLGVGGGITAESDLEFEYEENTSESEGGSSGYEISNWRVKYGYQVR